MDKKTEALKLAEDALKRVRTQDMELVQLSMIALVAIREALAEQPAQPSKHAAEWDSIEAMAAERYKVVPSHDSMFCRHAVVAGNGTQQLYIGREVECENMARKFAGAFLDGAFVMQSRTSPPAQPSKPLTDEQIIKMRKELSPAHGQLFNSLQFARAVEAAHGIVSTKDEGELK